LLLDALHDAGKESFRFFDVAIPPHLRCDKIDEMSGEEYFAFRNRILGTWLWDLQTANQTNSGFLLQKFVFLKQSLNLKSAIILV
jgi:hypothetical protein